MWVFKDLQQIRMEAKRVNGRLMDSTLVHIQDWSKLRSMSGSVGYTTSCVCLAFHVKALGLSSLKTTNTKGGKLKRQHRTSSTDTSFYFRWLERCHSSGGSKHLLIKQWTGVMQLAWFHRKQMIRMCLEDRTFFQMNSPVLLAHHHTSQGPSHYLHCLLLNN